MRFRQGRPAVLPRAYLLGLRSSAQRYNVDRKWILDEEIPYTRRK